MTETQSPLKPADQIAQAISALTELREKSTPAPWFVDQETKVQVYYIGGATILQPEDWYPRGDNSPAENAQLVVALRAALDPLIEILRESEVWERRVESKRQSSLTDDLVVTLASSIVEALAEAPEIDAVRSVLDEVVRERGRQDAKWGEQNHPDGTGPDVMPLLDLYRHSINEMGLAVSLELIPAELLAKYATMATDTNAAIGSITWADIFLEEVTEAIAEEDPVKLHNELIQSAAVATQWADAIKRRSAGA